MAPISERLKAVFSKSRSRSSSRTPTGNEPTRTSQQPGQGLNRPQLLPQVSQASGSDGNSGASSGAQTGALDIPASDHPQQGLVPAEAIAISKDPWDEAYDGLRKKESKLLACYERFLLSEANKSKSDDAAQRFPDLSSLDNFGRQSRLGAVLEAQKGALESAALGFKLGDYQVVVKDEFKRLVSAVIWAKDFIAAGAKNEPHAALAWAGVSVLLPLLLNPALQEKAATEALDHIQHVVLRYRVIQKGLFTHDPTDAVLADETSKLVTGLRSNTVKLYTHILELQLRMAIYLCRGTVSQYFRDVAKVDDWEDMLKQVKATEVDGEAMIQTLSHDKVDQIKRSTKEQAEQFAKVLLILESQGPVLHDIALRTKRIEDTQTKHIESHDAKARLLDSLYFPDYKLRVDSLTLPESKTFDWIFKTNSARTLIDWPSFPEWLERDSDPYWITGKAGSGKSTIMALIAGDAVTKTHLRVWAKDTVPHIFRFFFWRLAENTLMKSLEGMLRSLLYQIFRAMPELAKIIADQHVEDAIRIPTWTVQKLADLMMTSLALVTGEHSILFILDGLDELEGDQHTLLEFLKPMSGFSCVKLCLSSRAEVQLDRWFGCKAHLQMERLNARDIRIYAEQRLHSLVPTKELAKLTADRADGVFLWAVLVTDDLLRCIHKGYDESALEKRLARRPKKIEDLFAEILRGVDEDDRTTVYFFVRSMLLPRYHHPVTGRSYPLNIGLLATVMFAQETHISYQAFASKW
ncbi:hypothetical protein B0A55_10050 [Friedmanniomyces simplex]|uniref:NACHT domain-containing protein n=1 Tax=Friedmanniomyces simplex TaxID=329884 RepID=A0A4U0WMZ2_9PEZI|nr:hypothetical protein B0A55_10050 [Friedmanniomyces simplex]